MRTYKPKIGSKKRKYRNFSDETLQKAVAAFIGGTTYREVELEFGVPKSTLHRHIKGSNTKKMGGQTALTSAEEEVLAHHLIVVSEWGFPFSNSDVRFLVKGYLDKTGRNVKCFKDNMPGIEWVRSFLGRNRELAHRRCQNIKTSRSGKTEREFIEYFENLKEVVKDVPPSNILNFDETNLTDDPGTEKLIFRRGIKYPERIQNYTKSSTSVMFCGTAAGDLLEPYVVYKATHMWQNWTTGGPPRARYNRSKSGWFDNFCFSDWFKTVVLPWCRRCVDGPKVLIGDNLSSHFSPDIIKLCEENNIRFVCLVPNSTHLTQPLDVAFYGPMKRTWRTILKDWKVKNRILPTLPKDMLPKLLKTLVDSLNLENLCSGFKACGIYPLNPDEVLKRLPDQRTHNAMLHDSISELVVKQLQDMRSGKEKTQRCKRKRVNVIPGKSVTSADVESSSSSASDSSSSSEEDDFSLSEEEGAVSSHQNLQGVPYTEVKEGDWVKVIYEADVYVGRVLKKQGGEFRVRCLETPFVPDGRGTLEREENAIFYKQVFKANVTPRLKLFGRAWKYAY